jgi:hypothetical protein
MRKEQDTLGQIIKQTQRLQKKLNITSVLKRIQEYGRNWLQRTNRMLCHNITENTEK